MKLIFTSSSHGFSVFSRSQIPMLSRFIYSWEIVNFALIAFYCEICRKLVLSAMSNLLRGSMYSIMLFFMSANKALSISAPSIITISLRRVLAPHLSRNLSVLGEVPELPILSRISLGLQWASKAMSQQWQSSAFSSGSASGLFAILRKRRPGTKEKRERTNLYTRPSSPEESLDANESKLTDRVV